MKQTWKKIIGLILISVCILAMTACGKNSSEETSSLTMPDEASQQSLIESFGTVLQNISQLDEASIKSYMEGDDAFSASAASAWDASGSSLGSFEEVKDGKLLMQSLKIVMQIVCLYLIKMELLPVSALTLFTAWVKKWHRQVRIPLWVSESYLSCLSS